VLPPNDWTNRRRDSFDIEFSSFSDQTASVTFSLFSRILLQVDEPDFSAFYERHARDVYRFSLYLSGDYALAEDLTAETFARAWVARERIRVGTVKAYLLMIARNLYRDVTRRRAESPLPENFEVADRAPGPEAAAQARDELQQVLRALGRIPEHEREALLLATVEGLSHQAIAVALNLSVDAVKVRVHRARVRLNAVRAEMETTHVDYTSRRS
jgi:RNA polymerase sigma-70 factor (ECF subfamily)